MYAYLPLTNPSTIEVPAYAVEDATNGCAGSAMLTMWNDAPVPLSVAYA